MWDVHLLLKADTYSEIHSVTKSALSLLVSKFLREEAPEDQTSYYIQVFSRVASALLNLSSSQSRKRKGGREERRRKDKEEERKKKCEKENILSKGR